jgi:hypothetical protein
MKRYGIQPETLIIRGSQDHALVGPLENQALTKVYFVGAFSFAYNLPTFCQFPVRFSEFRGKTGG